MPTKPTCTELEEALAMLTKPRALRSIDARGKLYDVAERAIRALLERHEDTERLDCALGNGWTISNRAGPQLLRYAVHDIDGHEIAYGKTMRAAIDSARQTEAKRGK